MVSVFGMRVNGEKKVELVTAEQVQLRFFPVVLVFGEG